MESRQTVAARIDALLEAGVGQGSNREQRGKSHQGSESGTGGEAAKNGQAEASQRQGAPEVVQPISDAEFLRRVSLDLTGKLPVPEEMRAFVADASPGKRDAVVERLLGSEDFARHWARYWRDVILYRAADQRARLAVGPVEEWLTEQFAADRPWDEVATDFVTATGDVREKGNTVLVLAQMGQAPELAAETSWVFLGIQIQCAQCHDHPYDSWKREQFHELAAFFARVQVRPVPGEQRSFAVVSRDQQRQGPAAALANPRRLLNRFDANKDGKVARDEVPPRIQPAIERALNRGDKNSDNALSLEELEELRAMIGGGETGGPEHYMPDLENPAARGTLMHPVFFVGQQSPGTGKTDLERREALARYLTAPENVWFARAFVNRVWSVLMGWGFYEPVDDLGPGRQAVYPEALDVLAAGFRDEGYRLKWLVGTIVRTRAYQSRAYPEGDASHPQVASAACPSRLNADQLFEALQNVLGSFPGERLRRADAPGRPQRRPRFQFQQLFGYDPSTPADELAGTITQALFLMNSPVVHRGISAQENTRLGRLLRGSKSDDEVVQELYLLVLGREPTASELEKCRGYVKEVDRRGEAFEDILWSLLNSAEFRWKR